ncbi:MazG-like family protein [Streptomyces sp. NPDC012769]|uniref:MazG-like family protein n=1 Tax=Streptomyces sp. NPDC012769 TaxID=3364848 RepID=UPI00367DE19D
MNSDAWTTIDHLARLFSRLDTERGLAAEEQWSLQVLKMSEEVGEAAQAVIGARATNPRKGRSHDWEDVHAEVADAAITSLVSLARMRPDDAPAFFARLLGQKAAAFLPAKASDHVPASPVAPASMPSCSSDSASRRTASS